MRASGVVARTCAIVADLMAGAVHDRHTLARAHGVALAAADRYIRELRKIPGVRLQRAGRRTKVRWEYETGAASLHLMPSAQSMDLLAQVAAFGLYGTTRAEVAERLVDRGLEQFLLVPKLTPLVR